MKNQPLIKKQYGVFLSSTDDPSVREYRIAAREVIAEKEFREHWYAVDMSEFAPSSLSSVHECRKHVLSCSVYIGMMGPFYGSVSSDVDMSFTEYEYTTANNANRIVAIFMLPDSIISNSPADVVRKHAGLLSRQDDFKKLLNSKHMNRSVTDVDDFRHHLRNYLQSIISEIDALPGKNVKSQYDLFFSIPMKSVDEEEEYKKLRALALQCIEQLKLSDRFRRIYYAGRDVLSLEDADPAAIAVKNDLEALRSSEHFMLVYPEKVVSSSLVEAGYAIALQKPSFYFVRTRDDLPYMLRESPDSYPFVKIFTYTNEKNLISLIDKYVFPVQE